MKILHREIGGCFYCPFAERYKCNDWQGRLSFPLAIAGNKYKFYCGLTDLQLNEDIMELPSFCPLPEAEEKEKK